MDKGQTDNKLWNLSYILMLALNVLYSVSFYMIATILTKYGVSIGLSLSAAGVLSGMFSIVALVGRPFSGFLSDRLNKKYFMMIGMLFMGLSTAAYGVASNLIVLYAARIVHGMAFAACGTVNIALAVQFIPRKRMGEGIGYFGLGQVVASAIGPYIGLGLADYLGYRQVFYLSAVILVLSVFLLASIKYTKEQPGEAVSHKHFSIRGLFAKEALIFAVLGGIFSMNSGIISNYIALMAEERKIANIGLYFTVSAVVLFLIRPMSGKLLDKKGLKTILIPAYLLGSTGVFLLSEASSIVWVFLAAVLVSAGQGSGQPSLQASCINSVERERTGVATSTFYLGSDIGQGLGVMIGGMVSSAFGYGTMYRISAVIMIIAVVIFAFYNKGTEKQKQ